MNIRYSGSNDLTAEQLSDLYNSVGWSSYTSNTDLLTAAVKVSLIVVTAWDGSELVGLARAVGDGLTIVYLQDILVKPEFQHCGIGRELFQRVFAPYKSVRQKVLLTDDEPAQLAFYTSMGFKPTTELRHRLNTFVQFA